MWMMIVHCVVHALACAVGLLAIAAVAVAVDYLLDALQTLGLNEYSARILHVSALVILVAGLLLLFWGILVMTFPSVPAPQYYGSGSR
jgi:hypothetical protein